MKINTAGLPEIGASARALGIRRGIDVPAAMSGDSVMPGQGGMSVSPDTPLNLPWFRRPPEWHGTGRDPVWGIDTDVLDVELTYRPDPHDATHGFVEPSQPMRLDEYERALAQTQAHWQIESPATTKGATP